MAKEGPAIIYKLAVVGATPQDIKKADSPLTGQRPLLTSSSSCSNVRNASGNASQERCKGDALHHLETGCSFWRS